MEFPLQTALWYETMSLERIKNFNPCNLVFSPIVTNISPYLMTTTTTTLPPPSLVWSACYYINIDIFYAMFLYSNEHVCAMNDSHGAHLISGVLYGQSETINHGELYWIRWGRHTSKWALLLNFFKRKKKRENGLL